MTVWFIASLVLLLPVLVWAMAALWIDGPAAQRAGRVLAVSFGIAAAASVAFVRPLSRGIAGALALTLFVLLWWRSLRPRSDRAWEAPLARVSTAQQDGDRLVVANVRCFDYRDSDDCHEHWETRTYDLATLRGMDLFLSYWGPRYIAHTIASWGFEDGEQLAISIEVRKQTGEDYAAIESFFRRFELHYVAADERDLIRLRAVCRGEEVYLYPLRIERETARGLLLEYLREMNELAERPRWYNAVTRNCTTATRLHVKAVSPDDPWSWQILLNGHLDELGYRRGLIDTSLPFEELRRRSAIGDRVRDAGRDADFSARIRAGLPGIGSRDGSRSPGIPPSAFRSRS